MTEPPFRPSKDSPDFIDMRSSDERIYIPPHFTNHGERVVAVMSADELSFTWVCLPTGRVPAIRLIARGQPVALQFILTPDEMAQVGKSLVEGAEQMRDQATAEADDLLNRVRGKEPR